MKFNKFNSIKLAILIACCYSIVQIGLMNSLAWLVVDETDILLRNGCVIAILYLVQTILLYYSEKYRYVSSNYLKRQMSKWLDDAITKKSFEEFNDKNSGNYATVYVNDIPTIISLYYHRYLSIIQQIILSIFILLALYNIHWIMLIIGIVIIFLLGITPKLYNTKMEKAILTSQKAKESFLYRMGELLHSFNLFFENKAFCYYYQKSSKICSDYSYNIFKTDKLGASLTALLNCFSYILSLISLMILSVLVINDKVLPGYFLSTVTLIPTLSDAIASIMTDVSFYKSGKNLFRQKFDNSELEYDRCFCNPFFLQMNESSYSYNNNNKNNTQSIFTIKTKNISVDYGKKIIKIKDCCFKNKEKYAIVGPSGCGKSTLLKVIIGEISNYHGEVIINGEIKPNAEDILNMIGYVSQDTHMLNDTVYENISLGKKIDKTKVKNVLTTVGLDFNLDDIIEENGKNLSGGQKQRIALARVLVEDKEVIFVDEITAHLDKESANAIEKLLLSLDKMVVMITHHMQETSVDKFVHIITL